jgi:sarcosine oxidase subunit gamma
VADLLAGTEDLGLPLDAGEARLAALPEAEMASIAPFHGREAEVAAVLGVPLPTRRSVPTGEGRLIWAGLGVWFLCGPLPEAGLDGLAAVTAQGDGWTGLSLTGAAAAAVLARLVPLDLATAGFPPGLAARSMLRHVPLLLVRGTDGFEIFVPRSYAGTAVEEIGRAMRAVAARAALEPRRVTPAGA